MLGSPDTTSTIAGEAYYYISTTQKTVAFLKPREIDRQVVAVYFDGGANVQQVAHYGLKDGIVVNYYKDETPARGKDLGFIEQIFGNHFQSRHVQGSEELVAGDRRSHRSRPVCQPIGGRAPPATTAPRYW